MQISYLWNKFDLRRHKIAFFVLILFLFCNTTIRAQGLYGLIRSSGSDDKILSYGFFLATHTNKYQLKYSNEYLNPANPNTSNVAGIYSKFAPGFSLGFAGMLRFHDQFHLIFFPKFGFYEYRTDVFLFDNTLLPLKAGRVSPSAIITSNGNTGTEILNEALIIELPLLFKYKSERFNNTRMYFLGGGSYQLRTKSQEETNLDNIVTSGRDFSIEMGMGFEFYFTYFKWAPEIRFSHGLKNLYRPENTIPEIRYAISSIRNKSITIYLNFQ